MQITRPILGSRAQKWAFTLIELMVVISLIGLLTFIAAPAFRGFGQVNVIAAAQRQLQDDLSFARLQAIKNRSPVYLVFFMPPYNEDPDRFSASLDQIHQNLLQLPQGNEFDKQYRELALRAFTNTFPHQYTSYALFTEGSLGEQPGVKRMRYLTEWRTLPEGALFPTNGLQLLLPDWVSGVSNQFYYTNLNARRFPFPIAPDRANAAIAPTIELGLPALAFDSQGRLYNFKPNDATGQPVGNGTTLSDRFVAVSAGSVVLPRVKVGPGEPERFDFRQPADVVETPRRNYTNQILRVSALTGRAKPQKLRP